MTDKDIALKVATITELVLRMCIPVNMDEITYSYNMIKELLDELYIFSMDYQAHPEKYPWIKERM